MEELLKATDPISILTERFPLVSEIGFSAGKDGVAALLPSMALPLAAADGSTAGVTCLLYPVAGDLALSIAVIGALTRIKDRFVELLDEYARSEFRVGQRVEVLPRGHVYEFDGVFTRHERSRGDASMFRLKLVDTRRNSWNRSVIREPTVRSFPVAEILRLRATDRLSPRGGQTTDLGVWQESDLDRLLHIRSGGNTAMMRNQVLLLCPRTDVIRFARSTKLRRLIKGEIVVAGIEKAVTFGTVCEGGNLRSDEPGHFTQEPLIATTHSVEFLADACERVPPRSRLVIIAGVGVVARNLEAYDRIAASQRTVIIADSLDEPHLADLSARGCRVWKLTAEEICFGAGVIPDLGELDQNLQDPGGPFADLLRGAGNSAALRIVTLRVDDAALDGIASELVSADHEMRNVEDESARQPLGRLFGSLLELSSWIHRPSEGELNAFTMQLEAAVTEIDQQQLWLPAAAVTHLRQAAKSLQAAANSPEVGDARCFALLTALEHCEGKTIVIVTRNEASAAHWRDQLASLALSDVVVHSVSSIPIDRPIDALIVASWPRRDKMLGILARHITADVRVLTCEYEERWLNSLRRTQATKRKQWTLEGSQKAAITGVENWGEASDGDLAEQSSAGDEGLQAAALSLHRLERAAHSVRKRAPCYAVADEELRAARFIGFAGSTYAYMMRGCGIPVVTDLVRRLDVSRARIPIRTVEELKIGEYVLYREHAERDVISMFAAEILGEEQYLALRQTAARWRSGLLQISTDLAILYRHLQKVGVSRQLQTVRNWLFDTEMIGPAERRDVELVARASGDELLVRDSDKIWDAMTQLRGAHIGAGARLSEFLLDEIASKLPALRDEETLVDLTLGRTWIVQVEEIGDIEQRPYTEVNRLLWTRSRPR